MNKQFKFELDIEPSKGKVVCECDQVNLEKGQKKDKGMEWDLLCCIKWNGLYLGNIKGDITVFQNDGMGIRCVVNTSRWSSVIIPGELPTLYFHELFEREELEHVNNLLGDIRKIVFPKEYFTGESYENSEG